LHCFRFHNASDSLSKHKYYVNRYLLSF